MEMLHNAMPDKEILDLSHNTRLFSQALSLILGHVFQKLEKQRKTGRLSRAFGFKERFTVMAFVQRMLSRAIKIRI